MTGQRQLDCIRAKGRLLRQRATRSRRAAFHREFYYVAAGVGQRYGAVASQTLCRAK